MIFRSLALLVVLTIATSPALDARTIEASATLEPGEPVRIDIAFAELHVVAGEPGRLVVTGEVDETVRGVRLARDGGAMEVRTTLPLWRTLRRLWNDEPRSTARLRIALPADTPLFLVTKEGEVTVEGLSGPLGVFTVSSSVTVVGDPRSTTVETVTGAITFDGRTESLVGTTLSGDIEVGGEIETLELGSVDGSVDLKARLGRAAVTTIDGDVHFGGELTDDGELRVGTQAGAIDVALDFEENLRLRASTHRGEIVDERTRGAADAQPDPKILDVSAGSGRPMVRLRTHSGSVRIRSADRPEGERQEDDR